MLWAPFHKAFAFVIRKEERKKKKTHLRASSLRLTDSLML